MTRATSRSARSSARWFPDVRRAPPKRVTEQAIHAWLVTEQREREEFENHVKGELRDIKTALDLLLKAAEVEERHHDAIEGSAHV
jgi:hypothetical protein